MTPMHTRSFLLTIYSKIFSAASTAWKWQKENSVTSLSLADWYSRVFLANKKKRGTCNLPHHYCSMYFQNMSLTIFYCDKLTTKWWNNKWKNSAFAICCKEFKKEKSLSLFQND